MAKIINLLWKIFGDFLAIFKDNLYSIICFILIILSSLFLFDIGFGLISRLDIQWLSSFTIDHQLSIKNFCFAIFTSLIFYIFNSFIPSILKKNRLKKYLESCFLQFKRNCIGLFLRVCKEDPYSCKNPYCDNLLETLIDAKKFKKYFKEPIEGEHENRWYEVQNKFTESNLLTLIDFCDFFLEEINFAISSSEAVSTKSLLKLRWFHGFLSEVKFRYKHDRIFGYDFEGVIFSQLWSLCSNFDWLEGYQDESILLKDIKSL